jgi:hypothetical protein
VQQEVLPRVAVELGYQRRWLVNFTATDNRARAAEDHTLFGINIPSDSRLPNGGGGVLQGLYNVTPVAALRLNDNFQTLSTNFGDQTQIADSIYLNLTARPRSGLVLQGGFNTAKTDSDSCGIRQALPEQVVLGGASPTNPWCDTSTGWVTRVTGLGTYTIPKIDVLVAGTFRSDQGGSLAANWAAPNSATVGLNRPFAGVAGTTVTVNLIEPGTLYGDRVNQFDMRFAKILRFADRRLDVGIDLYNLFNANFTTGYQQTYEQRTNGAAWLTPTAIAAPRLARFHATFNF